MWSPSSPSAPGPIPPVRFLPRPPSAVILPCRSVCTVTRALKPHTTTNLLISIREVVHRSILLSDRSGRDLLSLINALMSTLTPEATGIVNPSVAFPASGRISESQTGFTREATSSQNSLIDKDESPPDSPLWLQSLYPLLLDHTIRAVFAGLEAVKRRCVGTSSPGSLDSSC